MGELLTPTFLLILLFSTIRLATPLIFAALGGMFSERAGVINIALEGLMLAGAFTAAVVTYELSNPYLGFLSGMAVGAAVALVFAVAVIRFEADQVVTGFAISLLMLGLPAVTSTLVAFNLGRLQDRFGRRLLVVTGCGALAAAMFWELPMTASESRISLALTLVGSKTTRTTSLCPVIPEQTSSYSGCGVRPPAYPACVETTPSCCHSFRSAPQKQPMPTISCSRPAGNGGAMGWPLT